MKGLTCPTEKAAVKKAATSESEDVEIVEKKPKKKAAPKKVRALSLKLVSLHMLIDTRVHSLLHLHRKLHLQRRAK